MVLLCWNIRQNIQLFLRHPVERYRLHAQQIFGRRRWQLNILTSINCRSTAAESIHHYSFSHTLTRERFVTMWLTSHNDQQLNKSSSSSEYGQTSTSWRLLTSGCGRAGSAECTTEKKSRCRTVVLIKIETDVSGSSWKGHDSLSPKMVEYLRYSLW